VIERVFDYQERVAELACRPTAGLLEQPERVGARARPAAGRGARGHRGAGLEIRAGPNSWASNFPASTLTTE